MVRGKCYQDILYGGKPFSNTEKGMRIRVRKDMCNKHRKLIIFKEKPRLKAWFTKVNL